MIYNQNRLKPFIFFLTLIIIIISTTYFYLIYKEKTLLELKYTSYSKNTNNLIENLLDEKRNATLIIAISLSKDIRLINFINNPSSKIIDYKKISDDMKENSNFKNVWIQLIDTHGNSIYRSWTDKKSENLKFRKDIQETLTNLKPSTSISVGNFDLTIKARVPIYQNNTIIGFIEIITHINSILEKLKEHNINSIVIVDKKYKDKIIYPFSNTFIADYYISTKTQTDNSLDYINSSNIFDFISIKNYIIKNNYIVLNHILSNKYDNNLGYIISFTKLEDIDIQAIKSFKTQLIMTILIALIILISIFIFYIYSIKSKNINNLNSKLKKHIKELRLQQEYKQSILDSQSNIIVITNGKILISSNKKLLDFFTDVKNLTEFKKKYICICTLFIKRDDDTYIINKNYDDKNWAEYILDNPTKNFKVAMFNDKKELRHFSINVSIIETNKNLIVTISDITSEINQIEINKQKDNLLFQQSKISAIADTLKNIAHQWRQPLSVISTIASGMKIEKELDILNDSNFYDSCNNIIENTKKLSITIDHFSTFFTKDDNTTHFQLIENIQDIINFLESIFEKNNIEIILSFDNDKIINCNKTDFSQAILNILDNSVYALTNNKEETDRFIFIEFKDNILKIRDSGDGINEKIISRILEPYFTTKHQSFGIGLGLYVVQEFFVKNLAYKIDIKNVTFEYKNKKYTGTDFLIDFN